MNYYSRLRSGGARMNFIGRGYSGAHFPASEVSRPRIIFASSAC
ncbi:hypothetical protein N9235_01490 [Gammaproteobacteria bacterium]|nr:hypothetical protein [Gammaproteobacteria bacterium]